MSADLTMNIKVGGTAEADLKQIKAATDAVKTSTESVSTAAKSAEKALKDMQKATDELARKGANVTEVFRKGVGGGEFAEKTRDIAKGIQLWGDAALTTTQRQQALAGAVGIGVRLASGYAAQFIQVASAMRDAATAAATQREQIAALNGAYNSMRVGSQGTLTSEEALNSARALSSQHIRLNAFELGTLTRAAHDNAVMFGGTTAEAMEHYTAALAGSSEEQIRLGITAGTAREQVARLALAQASRPALGRTAAEDAAVADASRAQLGRSVVTGIGQGTGILALVGAFDALSRSIDNARDHSVRFGSIEEAREAIRVGQARGRAQANEAAAQQAATLTSKMSDQRLVVDAAATSVMTYARGLEEAAKQARAAGAASMDLTSALQPGETEAMRDSRQVGAILRRAGQVGADRNHATEIHRQVIAAGATEATYRAGTGTGGGGGGENLAALRAELATAQAQARATEGGEVIGGARTSTFVHNTTGRGYHARLEAEGAFLHRMIELQTNANRANTEDRQRAAQQERDDDGEQNAAQRERNATRTNDARVALQTQLHDQREHAIAVRQLIEDQNTALRNQMDVRLQLSQAMRETLHADQSAAQGFATFTTNAFNSVTGSFKSHLAAYITGKETIGEALNSMLKETLLNVATEAALQSLLESARAIAAYATPATAAMGPGHTAAALAYAGVAVATGVGAGLMYASSSNAAPSVGAGGGFSQNAAGPSVGASGNGGGSSPTYIFNVSGGITDRDGFAAAVGEGLQQLAREDALPTEMRRGP